MALLDGPNRASTMIAVGQEDDTLDECDEGYGLGTTIVSLPLLLLLLRRR